MEISTKVRVVTAEHRCTAVNCNRTFGSATLLRYHQVSQHKCLGPPQRVMRLSSATNEPATPSSQASCESQQPSDDCQQATFSNGSINGFYSPSKNISMHDDHCNHAHSQSSNSIPSSSIGNRTLSFESDEIVGAGQLDHVNSSYIDSPQQKTRSPCQNSSQKLIESNTRPIVSPDLAEKLLSDVVQFINMLEGVHDTLLEASSCLEKAKYNFSYLFNVFYFVIYIFV